MIINGNSLFMASPIKNMEHTKKTMHGVSYGLGEAGYDIRISQDILFTTSIYRDERSSNRIVTVDGRSHLGRFTLASAMEEFKMPNYLAAVVHDKSTWARKRLSVFNTVIEPGWCGFLTLELVYHGEDDLHIPAGSGIAQVIFSEVSNPCAYTGKYQNQENKPIPAIESGSDQSKYCAECYQIQLSTPHGLVCENGHGGADSLEKHELPHGFD